MVLSGGMKKLLVKQKKEGIWGALARKACKLLGYVKEKVAAGQEKVAEAGKDGK